MYAKRVGISVITFVLVTSALSVVGVHQNGILKDNNARIVENALGAYEVEVIGNFLGYHIDVYNVGSEAHRQNDSIDVSIKTQIQPPGFLLAGGTLSMTIYDLPLPDDYGRYTIRPIIGLGKVLVEAELRLNGMNITGSEDDGFLFIILVLGVSIPMSVP